MFFLLLAALRKMKHKIVAELLLHDERHKFNTMLGLHSSTKLYIIIVFMLCVSCQISVRVPQKSTQLVEISNSNFRVNLMHFSVTWSSCSYFLFETLLALSHSFDPYFHFHFHWRGKFSHKNNFRDNMKAQKLIRLI